MKMLVRFRFSIHGIEVFNGGKWIVADKTIKANIVAILKQIAR
jgi:hypothetical protein